MFVSGHWLVQSRWPAPADLPFPWLLLMVPECGHQEARPKEPAPPLCSSLHIRQMPPIPFKLPRPCNSPFKSASCDFVALELLEEIKIQKSRSRHACFPNFSGQGPSNDFNASVYHRDLERKSLTSKTTVGWGVAFKRIPH